MALAVLFLSDTHLGLDEPLRPRVERRRRGPDFFANFERALEPALRGEADLVVHGGDLFYRSRVPPALVARAMAPLKRVADRGVPVCIVPGNHERSRIPCPMLVRHPGIFVFDRPRSFRFPLRGLQVALAGFPFVRTGLRDHLRAILDATGWRGRDDDVRLLCLHQAVEGARVGAHDYLFRSGDDVVRGSDLPAGFAAVLAGHVHRSQLLTHDLAGRPLGAPVLYSGSIERTSIAERDEAKGYLTLELEADGSDGGRLVGHRFHPLPARPMVRLELRGEERGRIGLVERLAGLLSRQHPQAVVRLLIHGSLPESDRATLRAAAVRAIAPASMNVSIRLAEDPLFRLDT
jgi:DNA repair exonuclease SbcCD nuclease subunit